MSSDDGLLAEQSAYYRHRAPNYDEWWQRRGAFDLGPSDNAQWQSEVAEVASRLDEAQVGGNVLEFAGGTGWWTERLAGRSVALTVVDSSPEVLAINRQRVAQRHVRYVEADLFVWEPDTPNSFDVVSSLSGSLTSPTRTSMSSGNWCVVVWRHAGSCSSSTSSNARQRSIRAATSSTETVRYSVAG